MKSISTLAVIALLGILGISDARAVYDPYVGRWLSRDPIAENGGINLYEYCVDSPTIWTDPLGLDIWVENTTGIFGFHQRLCVDTWTPDCKCKTGKACFTFGNNAKGSTLSRAFGQGTIDEDNAPDAGYKTGESVRYPTSCQADQKMLKTLQHLVGSGGTYNCFDYSCRQWSQGTAKQLAHTWK
jgi:uncharacterized protein RhaS with RHS repeats